MRPLKSLSHVIFGAGTPSAIQVSVALLGDTTTILIGGRIKIGGTVEKEYSPGD